MKKSLLFLTLIAAHTLPATAAPKAKSPAPKVRWEYAFVKENVSLGESKFAGEKYGVELSLQRRAPIVLPYSEGSDSDAFLLDVFSRLGSKGWELVSSPGYLSAPQYIFKRRK